MHQLSLSLAALVRSLHSRKGRVEEGSFLAEGRRLVAELPASPASVRFLFASEEAAGNLPDGLEEVPLYIIPSKSSRLFATDNAQGIGAVVEIPEAAGFDQAVTGTGPLLYLDRMADPGNFGTILRTADWFAHRSILLSPGCVDPYNPKSVRSTMGAIFRMELVLEVRTEELVGSGRPLVALDTGGKDQLGDKGTLPKDGIFVIGGEAHGVSEELLGHARSVSIERLGGGESLNAAVAAGILLYALGRG